MFDFGFSELLLIGAVALVVLGPERLPKAARMAGSLVGRVQRMVGSVKQELAAQVEMEELRKARQEFESAAENLRTEIGSVGESAKSSLNEISSGLKPWERVPEQRTPADFGVDGQGRLPAGADLPEADREAAWASYLMPSENPAPAGGGFQTASLHKQAMRRRRDMRPRHRPKPQLRVRKK